MRKTIHRLKVLCRGEPAAIIGALDDEQSWRPFCLAVIVAGSGIYGATIGLGRDPLQALYTALKFPILIILTTAGNALLNGMTAQLLGLGVSFRQLTLAITTSFALASLILASLSPVTLFLWFNTPSYTSPDALGAHNFTLVTHVFLIAFAGTTANAALFRLLADMSGSSRTAARILGAWLLGNMFLGCQLSWIMRPFIGSPGLPVEFFRQDAFRGNFYETTFRALMNLLQ